MPLAGFLCFKLTLNPLKFTSHQRNRYKKKLSNFEKGQCLNDKIDQNTNFSKFQNAKEFFFQQ